MQPSPSALFALLCALSASALHSLAAPRPNVLLLCVDDLKPALGCYGDALAKTPNLDRLAARGVRFDRAFCNQAVCSPSRNALMTSLRPQTLGIYDLPTHFRKAAPDAVTVGQYFKRHGYRTEGLGKIFHVGHGNIDDADSWSVPSWRPKDGGYALKQSTEGARDSKLGPRGAAYESADVPDNQYGDGMIADEAIERLRAAKAKAGEQFFLAVGFLKPHLPFVAPKKYWDMHDRNAFKLAQPQTPPAGAPGYAPQFGGELRNYKDIPAKDTLPADLQRTLIHGYYAATSYMDAQAGRVLAELEKLGLAQNTIVVLWGDHGWHLGEHGHWGKVTNYEDATRAPLIIASPGQRQGAEVKAITELLDVYPTLCDLTGLSKPAHLQGTSLTPLLGESKTALHEAAISQMTPNASKDGVMGWTLRTPRYRYIEWRRADLSTDNPRITDQVESVELYDYQTDPLERENLAGKPDHLAALKEQQNLFDKLLPHLPKRLE